MMQIELQTHGGSRNFSQGEGPIADRVGPTNFIIANTHFFEIRGRVQTPGPPPPLDPHMKQKLFCPKTKGHYGSHIWLLCFFFAKAGRLDETSINGIG